MLEHIRAGFDHWRRSAEIEFNVSDIWMLLEVSVLEVLVDEAGWVRR